MDGQAGATCSVSIPLSDVSISLLFLLSLHHSILLLLSFLSLLLSRSLSLPVFFALCSFSLSLTFTVSLNSALSSQSPPLCSSPKEVGVTCVDGHARCLFCMVNSLAALHPHVLICGTIPM